MNAESNMYNPWKSVEISTDFHGECFSARSCMLKSLVTSAAVARLGGRNGTGRGLPA